MSPVPMVYMPRSDAPIGVFDSGLGGLTVLKALAQAFPNESFLYLGDTARLPYGNKSPTTIRRYSEQNIRYLHSQVKAVVIACNSASSQFWQSEFEGLPVFNVIEPGAQLALETSKNSQIGVLATRATVQSGVYEKKLQELAKIKKVSVFSVACPLFVPLVEEGWLQDPITNLIVYRYLNSLLQHQIDTLILGCTHYPLLRSSIEKVTGSSVSIIESATAMVQVLEQAFAQGVLSSTTQTSRTLQIQVTDVSATFEELAHRWMAPLTVDSITLVDVR